MSYEKGKIRTDRGEWIDKGNYAVDPRHPDFAGGADPDGVKDSRAAFVAADEYAQTLGQALVISPGSYKVGTALTLTSVVDLAEGVSFTGAGTVTYTPRPTEVLDKGGVVYNARAYGIAGDGTDETPAVRQFFDTISAAGGNAIAYFPGGSYLFKGYDEIAGAYVNVPSNVTIRGAGIGKTTMVYPNDGFGSFFFRLPGVQNVTVEDMGFDINGMPGEKSVIAFRETESKDITVQRCRFYDSNPPVAAITGDRWAVSLANESGNPNERVRILDCIAENRIQLTANGGLGCKGLWILRNTVIDAEQNAIAVPFTVSNGTMENVWICDNEIIDPYAIGIYVGPDNSGITGGTLRKLTIRGNKIRGNQHATAGYQIFVRFPGTLIEDIDISDNDLDGEGAVADVYGVRVYDDAAFGTTAYNVRITNNRFRDMRYSVWAQTIARSRITDNEIDNCQGPVVRGGSLDVEISRNKQRGGSLGIHVLDSGTADQPIRVFGNTVREVTSTSSAGIRVEATSGQTTTVRSAHNIFRGNYWGIYHTGAGTIDAEHAYDDLRGSTNQALQGVSTAAGLWRCAGSSGAFRRSLVGSSTWTVSIAAGTTSTKDITVTGAAVGDHRVAGWRYSAAVPAGVLVSIAISAADTVTITVRNDSAGAFSVSGTWLVWVDEPF